MFSIHIIIIVYRVAAGVHFYRNNNNIIPIILLLQVSSITESSSSSIEENRRAGACKKTPNTPNTNRAVLEFPDWVGAMWVERVRSSRSACAQQRRARIL